MAIKGYCKLNACRYSRGVDQTCQADRMFLSAVTTPAGPPAGPLQARLLQPNDDVATALVALKKGATLTLMHGSSVRTVELQDDIPVGHKFAVRALGAGLRIRKYGEYIGRLTCAVPAGGWVHLHNLQTCAQHDAQLAPCWEQAQDHAPEPASMTALGDARCTVGENPLYDQGRDRLYWIDVRETPAIHAIDLADGAPHTWPMSEDIGSIALAGDGRLLVALRSGFAYFDVSTGTLQPLVDPEPGLPHNRLNDGRCDAAGRYWCGSMNPESGTADGSLYMLESDLRCHKLLDGFFTPNGLTWSLDGATLYIADTRRGLIHAHAFDLASAALGPARLFADLGSLPGGPDGATVDAQGYLWWAQIDGGCLLRYAPDGRLDRVLRLPVTKPTSCAFGGRDWRQMFVTTATRGLSDDERQAQPMAGRVLVLDVGVAGLPPVAFQPAMACA